jgi:hypothetical protein
MINSYWELYVAYIDKCVRDNWANDIDPHHYKMEWNHFLPRCIFGDWPIGQWLTLRQHAIASALQTLAFKRNCMFGWHKWHLPKEILNLSWPYYVLANKAKGERARDMGTGIHTPEMRRDGGRKVVEMKAGCHAPGFQSKGGKTSLDKGSGIFSRSSEQWSKDSKSGMTTTNSQLWQSTVDGFKSNAGNVAQHNRANGWDPNARIRVI